MYLRHIKFFHLFLISLILYSSKLISINSDFACNRLDFIAYTLLFIPLLFKQLIDMRRGKKKRIGQEILRKRFQWWRDKDFMKELDRRTEEYESCKVKGISFEKLKERIISAYKDYK